MATIVRTPPLTRCRHILRQYRHYSSTSRCLVNPLQNLSHFSAAKEAQFLSKERKIPREEFHPYIQLIRSSEVDIFAPVPGASPTVIAALEKAKTGKTDKETTYTLALSNLMSQVEMARRDYSQMASALIRLQERHQRDERNALVFMFAAVGLLSLIMLKTSALEDLKDYALEVMNGSDSFDRKWLHASPGRTDSAHKAHSNCTDRIDSTFDGSTPSSRLMVTKQNSDDPTQARFSSQASTASPEATWSFSNLFWTSAGRKRSAQ